MELTATDRTVTVSFCVQKGAPEGAPRSAMSWGPN